ncbi:uncharacterized protein UDID_19370 [Ustilago sp. UG-2017a]|nr:uncharacterized protein UDID_19370 [Ustilago sp. UG-2017a]
MPSNGFQVMMAKVLDMLVDVDECQAQSNRFKSLRAGQTLLVQVNTDLEIADSTSHFKKIVFPRLPPLPSGHPFCNTGYKRQTPEANGKEKAEKADTARDGPFPACIC